MVDQDVLDTRGNVALPQGSYLERIVRSITNNGYALGVDSVTVKGATNGQG